MDAAHAAPRRRRSRDAAPFAAGDEPPPPRLPERDPQPRHVSFGDKVFTVLFFASIYLLTRRLREKSTPQLSPGVRFSPAEIAALLSLLAVLFYGLCRGVKRFDSDAYCGRGGGDEDVGVRPHRD